MGRVQYFLVIERTFFCGKSLPGCLGSFNSSKIISEICLGPNRCASTPFRHSFKLPKNVAWRSSFGISPKTQKRKLEIPHYCDKSPKMLLVPWNLKKVSFPLTLWVHITQPLHITQPHSVPETPFKRPGVRSDVSFDYGTLSHFHYVC